MTNRLSVLKTFLWAAVGVLAAVTVVRFTRGLGAVTNLSDAAPWGLWIGFDVMAGVALAAGGFVLAAPRPARLAFNRGLRVALGGPIPAATGCRHHRVHQSQLEQPFRLEEHVFGTAEADALGVEGPRDARLGRGVGDTILQRRRFASEHLDHMRTALMWEPRGHADMYGCIITPPQSPEADFGVLFLHNAGYSSMCGHGIIRITKVALDTGLLPMTAPETTIRIDTPAGLEAIRRIAAEVPDMIVGAGSVRHAAQVSDIVNAGARFGVCPGSSPALLDAVDDAGLPFIPGAITASETLSVSRISVSTQVGLTVVQVTPCGAPSSAVARDRPRSPDFEAQ